MGMHLQPKHRSSGLSHADRNTYALALSFPERASRASMDRGGHGGAVGWNYVSASEDRQVGMGSVNGPLKAQVPQLLGIRPSQLDWMLQAKGDRDKPPYADTQLLSEYLSTEGFLNLKLKTRNRIPVKMRILMFNVVFINVMKRWLPVHVVKLMDRINGQHHFANVEPCHVFWKLVFKFTQQGQQITAHIVIHNQVLQIRKREYSS